MKVYTYLAIALGMIGSSLGYSAIFTLPPRQLDPPPANSNLAVPPTTGSNGLHFNPVYGCMIPSKDAKLRYCRKDDDFFDPAPFQASGAGQAYLDWFKTVDKSSSKWQHRNSKLAYFVQELLGWMDSDCSWGYHDCDNLPNCDDILTIIGDKDAAQQV